MYGVRKLLATVVPPSADVLPALPPTSPPRNLNGNPYPSPRQSAAIPTSPPSGPSSPLAHRKSVPVRQNTAPMNTRDELLISLMASEAVIDSRAFEILDAEQVDELKKEHQVLSSRADGLAKKLSTETKIRDAALSLSRVNAAHKSVAKQSTQQLDAANARVDKAQTDLWRVSDRLNDVHRRLMEHRAGVLSFSVRNLEKKMEKGGEDSGYDSSNRSTLLSPTSTSSQLQQNILNGLASPTKSRFDGAHLFAGHADTIVPKTRLSAEAAAAEIQSLESRLKEAKDALSLAGKKQVEMSRELSMLRLEKQQVETTMDMELQSAQETIDSLKNNLPNTEDWQREREELLARAEDTGKRLQDTERRQDGDMEEKDRQIQTLQDELAAMRAGWEEDRRVWEDEKLEDLGRLQEEMEMEMARRDEAAASNDKHREAERQTDEELEAGLAAVQVMVKTHGIVLFARDNSLQGLLNAIGMHLDTVHTRLDAYAKAEAEWDVVRRRLEDDVRNGLDRREAMAQELEEARKDRDVARRDTLDIERKSRTPSVPRIDTGPGITSGTNADAARIIALLQPLWSIMPSPEARAAKFAAGSTRTFRTGAPSAASPINAPPNSAGVGVVTSLSDLDVRSLKSLYATTGTTPAANTAPFSIEGFASRVQALINDDRALIERLVRFAQAHDLLKKNAERAQKLATEGTHALETYQKQVRVLEERNMSAGARQSALQEEIGTLQDTIERIQSERHELEELAAEQAETCRQLTEANNTLSARTLTLAEEAAQAPEMVRKQLEQQMEQLKKALDLAQDEVEAMRGSEQSQRIALLDELNSMQTENGNLRSQLRALKK